MLSFCITEITDLFVVQIECSVRSGTSLIDLSPLIKRIGYYEVLQSTEKEDSSDYYINICQPLNDVADVKCPPGASACIVTAGAKPIVSALKEQAIHSGFCFIVTFQYP